MYIQQEFSPTIFPKRSKNRQDAIKRNITCVRTIRGHPSHNIRIIEKIHANATSRRARANYSARCHKDEENGYLLSMRFRTDFNVSSDVTRSTTHLFYDRIDVSVGSEWK